MAPQSGGQPEVTARDYLAEERTFLAWIRTSLAVMGFGFVVARFGVSVAETQVSGDATAAQTNRFSLWLGAALIAVGVAVNLLAIRRHLRVIDGLNRGQLAELHRPSLQALVLTLFLSMVGVAMALYLILS
jgi:putative membrane protein